MNGMSGWNTMYPFAWFASGGDSEGDVAHNFAVPDGNFNNYLSQPSGTANASGVATVEPAGSMATHAIGAYAGYNNAALQAPGSQAPLAGGPAIVNGPIQGPWAHSDYAASLPTQYVTAAPPWKNGPMQAAASRLNAPAQNALHSTGTNPPAVLPATTATSPAATASCPGGCAGGCGGHGAKRFCKGANQPAVGLDSTSDFPPLYSRYQANRNQTVNAALYQSVSTHTPAWSVAQGVPADTEEPIQGA
jgi:hypothetical protein